MKPVIDLSIFQNRRAKQIRRDTRSVIYHESPGIPHDDFLKLDADLPLGCEYFVCSHLKDYEVFQRRINQPFFSIQYVQSGSFYIRTANKGFLMESGEFVILPPGQDNDLLFLPEQGEYRGYGLILTGPLLPILLEHFGLVRCGVLKALHPERVESRFRQLHRELLHPEKYAPEKTSSTIYELLLFLREGIAATGKTSPAIELTNRICEELLHRMAERISMPELAKKYGISLPVMNRIFRETIHKTPYQYLIRVRMEAALQLLTENLRIKEIAASVGYADPLHFSTEFRKMYRCSPREYRRKITEHSGS